MTRQRRTLAVCSGESSDNVGTSQLEVGRDAARGSRDDLWLDRTIYGSTKTKLMGEPIVPRGVFSDDSGGPTQRLTKPEGVVGPERDSVVRRLRDALTDATDILHGRNTQLFRPCFNGFSEEPDKDRRRSGHVVILPECGPNGLA